MTEQKKKILVFFRNHLAVGGVETYMYEQAKRLREKGWTIVWVRKHPWARLDSALADVFGAGNAVVWNRRILVRKMAQLAAPDAVIKVVAFNMFQFAQAERFKKQFRGKVSTFLFMPHYKGEAIFFEENHSGSKREEVRQKMAAIYRKLHEQGNLRYFNIKQMEATQENCGFTIEDINGAFVPPRETDESQWDAARCRSLAERQRFNLLTVSRFDFPHKAYLLGLIRAYAQLKPRYPRLELTIVGYGREQAKVEAAVNALPEEIRRDVHLMGKASPEALTGYYQDANLNISLASCCSQGARIGCLSIPARHYDETCQVYGFFPESKGKTVCDEPGEPVIPYIEAVLNMEQAEYVRRCRDAFDTFHDASIAQRKTMEEISNLSAEATLSAADLRYITRQEYWRELRSKKRGGLRIIRKGIRKIFG